MENILNWVVSGFLFVIVYMASMVTYHTARSDYFDQKQKIIICVFSWLIPIIGPTIVLSILATEKPLISKPGIPLLQFIFLAAVIGQSQSSSGSSSDHEVPDHATGSAGSDDT
jgi:hypothetical protein